MEEKTPNSQSPHEPKDKGAAKGGVVYGLVSTGGALDSLEVKRSEKIVGLGDRLGVHLANDPIPEPSIYYGRCG
jgi:hypothetical protein